MMAHLALTSTKNSLIYSKPLWFILALVIATFPRQAMAQCEGFTYSISDQAANYVTLQTNSNGEQEEVTVSMTQVPGGGWTNAAASSEGSGAESTFKVKQYGTTIKTVVAKMTHKVESESSSATKTTNGSAQFKLNVNAPSGGTSISTVRVSIDTYKAYTPSDLCSGTVEIDSVQMPVRGRTWATRSQKTVDVAVGSSLDLITMGGEATLEGAGSISVETLVVVSFADCTDPLTLTVGDFVDDPDDDEDDPIPPDCPPSPDAGAALHMRLPTGNIWTVVPILKTFADDEPELDLELRYDSQRAAQNSPLGYGWTHSYHVRVRKPTGEAPICGQKMILWTREGRRNAYKPPAGSTTCGVNYTWPPGRSMGLIWNSPLGSTPTVVYPNGEEHRFNVAGALTSIIDRRGRTTTFTYDASSRLTQIMSPHGRKTIFDYTGSDPTLISSVTDPDNKTTTFDYTGGNLTKITDPLGKEIEYGYDAQHRITGERLKNYTTTSTGWSYSAEYGVSAANLIRDGANQIVAKIVPIGALLLPPTRSETIAAGNLTYTDGRGKTWTISRDKFGHLKSIALASDSSHMWSITYGLSSIDPSGNRVIEKSNELGHTFIFGWDESGNMLSRKDPLQNVVAFKYENILIPALMTRKTEPDTRVYNYEYFDDPAPGQFLFRRGDLKKIIDPIIEPGTDAVATFAYETHPSQMTGDPAGAVLPGRLKKVTKTDGNGHVETSEYDRSGNLVTMTRASGGLNLVTTYGYDLMGRQTSEIIQRGDTTIENLSTYDAMGRLIDTIEDSGGLNLLTHREYDSYGNLTKVTNPRGYVTKLEYDARNRLVKQTEAEGILNLVSAWTYDGNGNVLTEKDANEKVTTHEYNDYSRRIRTLDAENYETLYTPDVAGRVTNVKRALAPTPNGAGPFYEVAITYDSLSRVLTRKVAPTSTGLDPLNPAVAGLTTSIDYGPTSGCNCTTSTPGTSLPNKITDPAGKLTFFQYDKRNRLLKRIRKVTDVNAAPDGDDAVTSYEYDPVGNLKKITGPEGEQIEYAYDAADRKSSRTLVDSVHGNITTTYGLDGADNVVTVTNLDGGVTTITYDKANRPSLVNDTIGSIVKMSYDTNGNVTRRADGLDHTWQFSYDAADRLEKEYDPIVESSGDKYTQYVHDAVGNKTHMIDRNGVTTNWMYDGLNRLTLQFEDFNLIALPGCTTCNTKTTYGYNGVRQTSITDHDNNTTSYEFDAALRLKKTIYPDGAANDFVQYVFNAAGKLHTRTDQRSVVTAYTYNHLHQLTGRAYSGGGFTPRSESFTFDRSDRLKTAVNGAASITRTYDGMGRPDSEVQQFLAESATYTTGYDYVTAANDVRRIINYPGGNRTVTQSFDKRRRMTSVSGDTGVGEARGYDAADRLASMMRSNNVGDIRSYDDDDRLTWLVNYLPMEPEWSHLSSQTYGYDAVGNRLWTSKEWGGVRSEAYTYDRRHRLTKMERGELDEQTGTIYAPISSGPLEAKQEWSDLDRRGNWQEYKATAAGLSTPTVQTRTVNGVNEYGEINWGVPSLLNSSIVEDAAGNVTMIPYNRDPAFGCGVAGCLSGDEFIYDEENRLIEIRKLGLLGGGSLKLAIQYDALGRRIETTDYIDPATGSFLATPKRTLHAFSGLDVIQEYQCDTTGPGCSPSGWSLAREFVWGRPLSSSNGPEPVAMVDFTDAGYQSAGTAEAVHYLRDVLGSVIGLANSSGTLVEKYTYDPYGRTLVESRNAATGAFEYANASAFGNPWMWTGQRYDAGVKLYHFLFRSYSPVLGRWLQRDPLGYVDGVNLYEYLNGDPIKGSDPYGLLDPAGGFKYTPEDYQKVVQQIDELINSELGPHFSNGDRSSLADAITREMGLFEAKKLKNAQEEVDNAKNKKDKEEAQKKFDDIAAKIRKDIEKRVRKNAEKDQKLKDLVKKYDEAKRKKEEERKRKEEEEKKRKEEEEKKKKCPTSQGG